MVSPRFIYSLYESRLQKGLPKTELPKHIGLIHDGHRRYARRENLLSYEVSYKIGMVRFKECLSWCDELGIDYVTSWLLSKENLSHEVTLEGAAMGTDNLIKLARQFVKSFTPTK